MGNGILIARLFPHLAILRIFGIRIYIEYTDVALRARASEEKLYCEPGPSNVIQPVS
jgi:hypothetical protein